jgi:type VI secretion system protein VasD
MFGRSPPPPPLLQVYNVRVSMEKNSNLSAAGIALPLKIRMFKLKNSSSFMSEDFFTLQSDGASVPNSEFISQEQLFLRPGQKPVSVRVEKTGELRFIGFVAEYQQLDGKIWRQAISLADPSPVKRSFIRSLFSSRPTSQNTEITIVATRRGLTSVVVPAEND